ncbi:hypothetical protein PMV_205 [Port-miou virus]|nr:hypothetical protein PMV_205 [Port-miou virus]
MQSVSIKNTKATHVDILLPSNDVQKMCVCMEFAPSKMKKTVFVFFTLEGVERPWKSEAIEINLSKRKTRFMGEIIPSSYFDKREGIAPHLCVCILDEEKKHFKSTVQWSLEAEF